MEDDKFLPRVIFSDEATLHLSGKVNRHNVRIWGLQNPHTTLEHERDSPKVIMFCAISQTKVYGPSFFDEKTVTGVTYLAMLQNWILPQINEDSEDFTFQQDGAPPHWHRDVRRFLNESLSHSPCDLQSGWGFPDHKYKPVLVLQPVWQFDSLSVSAVCVSAVASNVCCLVNENN
jgi:hypothetical protein